MPANADRVYDRVVAIDTSVLLSADSFIAPCANQSADPYSALSFEIVATAFCNGARLFLPLPEVRNEIQPELLKPWSDLGEVVHVGALALPSKQSDDVADRLAEPFATFVDGSAHTVATWLAFHFSRELAQVYLARASMLPLEQCARHVAQLLEDGRLKRLQVALDRLTATGAFRIPLEFQPAMRRFDSETHLAMCYAFSVFLRGWSYALGLSRCEEKPCYYPHWLRAQALRTDLEAGIIRVDEPAGVGWFPWGAILRNVFDPEHDLRRRDFPEIRDALFSLRQGADQLRSDLAAVAPHDTRETRTSRPSDGEVLVLRALKRAGIVPRHRNAASSQRFTKFLTKSVGSYARKITYRSEFVSSVHQYRIQTELDLRIRFRRSTVWDVFDDAGIRSAVSGPRQEQAAVDRAIGNLPRRRGRVPAKEVQPLVQNFYAPIGNFAQNSHGFTQHAQWDISAADLEKLVIELGKHLAELKLNKSDHLKVTAQLATIDAQLADAANPVIVREAGRTIRNLIEGAIGNFIATATQPTVFEGIYTILQKF